MSSSLNLKHLLGIKDVSKDALDALLELAAHYAAQNRSPKQKCDVLAGHTVVNMFFENSTRTRTSFEIAAKRLGADVVNFTTTTSSLNKGETFSDTMRVIDAMLVSGIVIRHPENDSVQQAAALVRASILNAGNGTQEHPTQALLDALTIIRHKKRLEGLKVAICGDIEHSRVARSNAFLLRKYGADVRFFAPPMFVPHDLAEIGVTCLPSMDEALRGADVVMMLRIQNERLAAGSFKMDGGEYHRHYGLNHERLALAKEDVIVLHPAPMNRGIEITDALADDPKYSVIFEQMEVGVAVRMACLHLLINPV